MTCKLSRNLLRLVSRLAVEPDDSAELRARKIIGISTAIVGAVLEFGTACLLWQFNEPLAATIVTTIGLLFLLGLFSPYLRRQYVWHGYYFFVLAEIGSFLVTAALGGFAGSGMFVIWALIAPLMAILAHEEKDWLGWFLTGLVSFIGIAVLQLYFPRTNQLPGVLTAIMLIVNTLGFALLMLVSLRYHIRKNQKLHYLLKKEQAQLRGANRALRQSNADLAKSMAHLHATQAQLVQQDKLASLGALVAGIAHEVNTPVGTAMMAVSGIGDCWRNLQTALRDNSLSRGLLAEGISEGLDYTHLAQQATSRTADLITKFKAIVVHADDNRWVDLDLASYWVEVSSLVQGRLEQIGCRLECELHGSGVLHVKPDALTEALTRILANVVDHAFDQGRTGTLRLRTSAENEQMCKIEVIDDGHGIAPEHLPHVFDPFFTTKSGSHGHIGLGLHVAYNHITQGLHGKILIESQLGHGTRVTLLLPPVMSESDQPSVENTGDDALPAPKRTL